MHDRALRTCAGLVDSFYEYLLKAAVLTNDMEYLSIFNKVAIMHGPFPVSQPVPVVTLDPKYPKTQVVHRVRPLCPPAVQTRCARPHSANSNCLPAATHRPTPQ